MKTINKLIAVSLAIALLFANVPVTLAMPPLPSSFYGTAKIDGANVLAGTVVSAWINGIRYAYTTVILYDGETVYSLDVAGDDPSTPGIVEGGVSGNSIVFHIGELAAGQTGTWASGSNVNRNLTATSPNHLPTISDIADQSTPEDTAIGPLAFTVGDLETPASALTLSAASSNTSLIPVSSIVFGGSGANRSVTITPAANQHGQATITITVGDAAGGTAYDSFILTVTPVNDAPVAVNDSYTTNEDAVLSIAAPGVLSNDTDVDGNSLTAALMSGASHGTLTLNANGSFVYTPTVNYNGSDSFTYRANDGAANSNVATVNLTVNSVNDAPVAVNDSYSTNEDVAVTIAAPGVLSNDTDVEGNPLTAVVNSGPTHGTLTLNVNGSFVYTPTANYTGSDSFTYRANDGTANSNTATVSLTIHAVNDAPVAMNDSYVTTEDAVLTIATPGVIANDTDVDGDPLTAALAGGVSHGTLTLNANGSFVYTPTANYNGSDSFTYRANDGTANSNTATVSLTINHVNHAPVAANDSYNTNEDTVLSIASPGVLSNDTDADGNPLTATLVSGVSHGTLTLNANGSFVYTPTANYNGSDSFTYRANDGTANSNVATVTILINSINDAPNAVNDAATTAEDTPVTVNVLLNDTDLDNDSLSVTSVGVAGHGLVTTNGTTVTYTPTINYTGLDKLQLHH